MSRDALNKIAAQLEADGFTRGYRQGLRDARKAFLEAIDRLGTASETPAEPGPSNERPIRPLNWARRLREGTAQQRVHEMVQSIPGLRGIEIVNHLKEGQSPVDERTVRTALSRLKRGGKIRLIEGGWHPIVVAHEVEAA